MRYTCDMKNAILLHGWNTKEEFFDPEKPTASNDHWFPWLTKQLMMQAYKVDVPEMSQHTETTYETWKREFERFDLKPDTLLVGHSLGGGFLMRYLTENDVTVGRVVLVAPWMGTKADESLMNFNDEFFSYTPDGTIATKTAGLHVIYSDDDFQSILQSVAMLRESFDHVQFHELHNTGHFTLGSLGTVEFPKLLEVCTQL
jgi:predicted alpha/beta hydrolase family esterase